ncbi:unnamed protein product [Clonostachys rosea f. rosea IK726]|uniref:Uncharacterized protein n=1 Tax=Clonostachys rosea f. rosea IK726 TaxID=1349383 RepID=A0ACA9TXY1_BIOOC|nr:unnamed protein product [Clonostachys rosea f. rosea IK726]
MMFVPGTAPDDQFNDIVRELLERYYDTSHYKVKPKAKEVGIDYEPTRVVTLWIDKSEDVCRDDSLTDDEKHTRLFYMVPFITKEVENITAILKLLRNDVDAPMGVSVIELELFVFELIELLDDCTAVAMRGLRR